MEASDLEFIQDQALDFFKNQTLKNAILESVDILEGKGDFDSIKTIIFQIYMAEPTPSQLSFGL